MRVNNFNRCMCGAPQHTAGKEHAAHRAAARANRNRRSLRPRSIWNFDISVVIYLIAGMIRHGRPVQPCLKLFF